MVNSLPVRLRDLTLPDDMEMTGKGHAVSVVSRRAGIVTTREAGFRTVELGTGNSSVHQLCLYQKCEFRIVGVDVDFFVRHYDEAIYENGIHCRDMGRLKQDL